MLKQTTVYLNPAHMRHLDRIAKSRGLRAAHLVRLSIVEFIRRERSKK